MKEMDEITGWMPEIKTHTVSACLTFRPEYNVQMRRGIGRRVPIYTLSFSLSALVTLRHPVSFLHFQYLHTYRMFSSISPSIQDYCFRSSSHNAPFIRCSVHTISQPRHYKSPNEKCMGRKQKQETSRSWNGERLQHGISFGMQRTLFSPQQKDKRTKQQGSLSPEPVDKQQEEGVRNLWLKAACRATNAQLLSGWESGSDSVPQAHVAFTELWSESVSSPQSLTGKKELSNK